MRIETLELHFRDTPHAIAAFLVRGSAGPVLVETGPMSTLDRLRVGLAAHGVRAEEVRHVLVTHIHLDHAGAAGWWAQQGATVYVHPVGAPHLVDPSKLLSSAARIYGDQMDELWGQTVAAPAGRVVAIEDGETIEAEGLSFRALATPGHASHHHVFRLGDVAFTGDAVGIRLPRTSWIELPAPPPEFDLEQWKATLARLRRQGLREIYRTHFGVAAPVYDDIVAFEARLDETAAYVRGLMREGLEREAMIERYGEHLRRQIQAARVDPETARAGEVANPRAMTVDGICRYWRQRGD